LTSRDMFGMLQTAVRVGACRVWVGGSGGGYLETVKIAAAGCDQEAARCPCQCGSGIRQCEPADLSLGAGVDHRHAAVRACDCYRRRVSGVIGCRDCGHWLVETGLQPRHGAGHQVVCADE
jgi:hypothetical protein